MGAIPTGADTQVCPYAALPGRIYFSKTIKAGTISASVLESRQRRLTPIRKINRRFEKPG